MSVSIVASLRSDQNKNHISMYWKLLPRSQMPLSICLGAICIFGDMAVERNGDLPLLKAICDNFTHALIGFITAIQMLSELREYINAYDRLWMIIVSTCVSSLIDVDHFIAANSWQLRVSENRTT